MNIFSIIYDLYFKVYNWLIILFRGEGADCIFEPIVDLLIIIGAFVGILAGILWLCSVCVPFNKIMNLAVGVIGLILSVELIDSSLENVWIGFGTAFVFGIYIYIIVSPLLYTEETAVTSYYLVLGTLISETKTEGGVKALMSFLIIDIIFVTWLGGHVIINIIGYRISGIICVVVYSVLLALNVISGIRYINNKCM